ncbi:hypothetical protein BGZ95_002456 [Linnemannia exigua]|uniref:Uncharacterized protein n=1 Tax=Linnemannia exigua TaxID=604196 RepID=A0AAD4D5X4_9FUNG|nr:hypothetical protein BGZ95_002456 [Linnemannia exigua]
MSDFSQLPTCTVSVDNMKEQHRCLPMPQPSSSSWDDGGLQDDLYTENDRDIQESAPPTTAQYGNGDYNDDVPTSNGSETDEDEDTEDSNGDEDNDDYSQDEDNDDVSTSNFSETDEDEDTEDSNGDEDDDDCGQDEDNDDVSTSNFSETDEDEDTEDSNGDEDDDYYGQDEGSDAPLSDWIQTDEDEDSNRDKHNEDDIGSPGPQLAVRSYFSMKSYATGRRIPADIKLKCTKTESLPVTIAFSSKSVEWTLYPHELDSTKDYELVVGISSKKLRIADIEEVVFTVNGVEERVEQESHKDEVLNEDETETETTVYGWKLATLKTVHYNNRMEVRVTLALKLKPMALPLQTKGFALHYMELHSVGTMNWSTDMEVRVYRPLYDWALDIRSNGADDIIPCAISESGDYLVTYRTTIELWDLTNSSPSMPPNSTASTGPFSISAAELEHLSLSISWDGSQIAVSGEGSYFKLFERSRLKSKLEESSKAKTEHFAGFGGRGIFHRGAGSQRQDPDEIFVAVDQNTVHIYSVQHDWKLLRIIRHTSPESSDLLNPRPTSSNLSNVIQGRHFTCRDNMTDSIFIWNLDSGHLVRTIKAAGESDSILWISKEGESFKAFVKDRFWISRHTWKSSPCNKDCLAKLTAARKNVLSFIDFESRLQFSVIFKFKSVLLTIANLSGDKFQYLDLEEMDRITSRDVTFSPKDRVLIVRDDTLTSIYEMPRSISEVVSLVSVQDFQDHWTCDHERSYFRYVRDHWSLLQLKKDQLATVAPAFIRQQYPNGLLFPRYVDRHINQHNDFSTDITSDNRTMSIMERLCREWDIEKNGPSLFVEILSLPKYHWAPRSKMEFNPVQYFLAKSTPKALNLFHHVSDKYHQWAKSEQNLLFLSPIAFCLPTLLADLTHSKLVILMLQRMAFFPVSLRSVIMERHALIHPSELRVMFWNSNPRPLPQCEGPILQLNSSGVNHIVTDTTKDTFREEIFAATFNMIWTCTNEPNVLKDPSYPVGVSPSIFYWITMVPFVVAYKIKPWQQKAVVCHKFPLDALDNPALSALILYKW